MVQLMAMTVYSADTTAWLCRIVICLACFWAPAAVLISLLFGRMLKGSHGDEL